MKKNLFFTLAITLCTIVLLQGCKKQMAPSSADSDSDFSSSFFHKSNCQLVHLEWFNAFVWDFHYNNKGLADQWKIDIGDGFPQFYTMEYDRFNRLVRTHDSYTINGTIYTDLFTYSGNRLARHTWTNNITPDQGDVRFTYNGKGEIVREDDPVNDLHNYLFYDRFGNCTRSDYYAGSDLYFSDNYTFNFPIENPCLTVRGVDIMFPYSGTGLWNKWWFTSNKGILYDNGTPIVANDYDPRKTIMKTGFQHHLVSADYFDNVTQAAAPISFGYDNCSGHWDGPGSASSQNKTSSGGDKTIAQIRSFLFHASAQMLKDHLKDWIKQAKENQARSQMN